MSLLTPLTAADESPKGNSLGVSPKFIAFILLVIVAVRLATLGLYPLGSTTEPRYAEIARKMLETGNWVTPWFDHGVPFWGKPPLSFWGSAITMGVFGVNEFGARLAPFLAALGCGALFWAWPRPSVQRHTLPMAAAVVLLSSVVGFIASAAVMTDMFMALGTALCMVAFWVAVNDRTGTTVWRWLFFVGIAVGLLAKGPVATVITGVALTLWVLVSRRWGDVWHRLPWVSGSLLAAALTLPWYLLAESRTPGFLQYFIVGEHVQRFLVSGWTGDLYGQGHAEPRGLIWWFGFGGFLPWSVLALLAMAVRWSAARPPVLAGASTTADLGHHSGEWQYLLAWTVSPLLFFTAARNILEAYVLPGLPAFALLTALLVFNASRRWSWLRWTWALGLVCPLLWAAWLGTSDVPDQRSHKALLQHWTAHTPLVYLGARPLSANFYSWGEAQLADQPADIQRWLRSTTPVTLVVQPALFQTLTPQDLAPWVVVARHDGFTMLRPVACCPLTDTLPKTALH